MTSLLPSTIRPLRVERLRAGAVAACLVLAAGCSSDSGNGSDQATADREPTDQVVENDAASSDTGTDTGTDTGSGADDATDAAARELLAQAEVCDLVDPMALDVAAAFGAGFELVEIRGTDGRCQLDLVATADSVVPAGTEANLYVLREPAVLGDDVAAHARSYEVQFQGESRPAPSVSDDAVVLTDGDSRAIVLFSAGGRVWSVRSEVMAHDVGDVGGVDDPTAASAAAVRSGLLAS